MGSSLSVSSALLLAGSLWLTAVAVAQTEAPPPVLPAVPVVIASFGSVGIGPWGVAFDPIHSTMWISTANNNSLTEYDLTSPYSIVKNVSVANPFGVAFDSLRGNVWVADATGGTVTVVNSTTGAVLAVKKTGGASPAGVCFDGGNVWVTNSTSNTVTKFNGATFGVIGVFAVLASPQDCAADPTTAQLWITDQGSNQVTVLNFNGSLVMNFAVGKQPVGIAFDGTNMWVANQGGNKVWKINATTFATAAKVSVPTGPRGVIYGVGAGTPYVWAVSSSTGTLTQINAATAMVTGVSASFGTSPQWGAFDPVNNNVWVASTSSNSITVLH